MMLDALLNLGNAQSLTTTALATNTIDLSVNRELASGGYLGAIFAVDQSIAATGAATVNFQLVVSASPTLSSPTVLAQTGPVSKTELPINRRPFTIGLAPAAAINQGQRYLGVRYEIANGPLTAGAVSCWLTTDKSQAAPLYQSGWSVA